MTQYTRPEKHGLFDPALEQDSCGVGFVAHIKGERTHQMVLDADIILQRMTHRGACGCETNTGDGCGMLTGMPDGFLRKVAKADLGADLPEAGKYSAGIVFLPTDDAERETCKQTVERIIKEQGQTLIGWRDVPTDPDGADIGHTARVGMPTIEMLFVGAGDDNIDPEKFERTLYVIRKQASHELRLRSELEQRLLFYICTLSTGVMVYKGMLTPEQLLPFFPDLRSEDYTTHLAMVHSRFSTNTLPSWDRAQPFRFMSHNGEINTLLGNSNWMNARQGVLQSDLIGEDLEKCYPIVEPECSDSGNFDNALELLLMGGRTLQEAVMMMVPEAWENHESMSPAKRAFYEYHACLQEPWDGPASIAFTDGHYIGACLDRNGLRPSRFYVTHDDRVIMASEVGVLDVDPANVKLKGRLQPGRMFLVDFEQGRLVPDEELKNEFAAQRPYGQWLKDQRIDLSELEAKDAEPLYDESRLLAHLQATGFTQETMQFMLIPLIEQKRDPVGSMGNDAALAVLSDKPRMLYDYFKQRFAQVTNPPIDSIREEIVMSLECFIGPEQNLLDTTEAHAHRLMVPHPILTDAQLAAIKHADHRGWKTKTIDTTWPVAEGAAGMAKAIERVCAEAEAAIDDGDALIVLSDRATSAERVAMSALAATGAVHHHLVKQSKRTRIGIVVESGEAREVHHFCLLVGYGADAINPYLAFQSLRQARLDGALTDEFVDDETIVKAYRKGVAKGMLKVMAKMGISTLASYKGAQIFEAVGLHAGVIDRCFAGTASRISGVAFDVLAEECLRRHAIGFPRREQVRLPTLPNDGQFHWRAGGERHMINPETVASLQIAARTNSTGAYEQYARLCNEDARTRATLRGLLDFNFNEADAVPLDEVEPAKQIVKRFRTGAMSYGSISAEAHESLAIAMNRLGGKSNTGEGGEDPDRFTPDENGDLRRSSIKQVASGRFGVTSWYLTNADEIQIKIVQGAKPGEGGELPGHKVNEIIAATRHSTPGVGLISPPPHHDIYSIEDLAQLIHDLKNTNPKAGISVKLVSEVGVGTVAAGVAKAHADHILVSGHDGGTGASPLTSIKHAGLPWELGVAETHQSLVANDLRSRVRLETDGQFKTGRDVVIAALLGAEEYGFATAPLITLGCIMMRKCHLNTCPVGIATQDPELRAKFNGKPEHTVNYLFMVAEEARQIMAKLGVRKLDDLIGRVDLLQTDDAITHWKSDGLDLSAILTPAQPPAHRQNVGVYKQMEQDHGIDEALDNKLIELAEPALKRGEKVTIDLPVVNTNRVVGTMLANQVSLHHGMDGLPDETIHIKLTGSAGQSLGAWLTRGITIELEGDANDYVGKGLCGGKIVIYPPKNATFTPEDNILLGNVTLYGATSGKAFFRGVAAERFCVRNSGAIACVEGVGDHGLEYMTGGRVVVLGPTGRNFAAGMSGGVAYVYDPHAEFMPNCNLGMVELEAVEAPWDIKELRAIIEEHHASTGSTVAEAILADFEGALPKFVKVMPTDYKRVLAERLAHDEEEEARVHMEGAGAEAT